MDAFARTQDLQSPWLIVGIPEAEIAHTRHSRERGLVQPVLVPGARNLPIAREVLPLYGEAAPSAASAAAGGACSSMVRADRS